MQGELRIMLTGSAGSTSQGRHRSTQHMQIPGWLKSKMGHAWCTATVWPPNQPDACLCASVKHMRARLSRLVAAAGMALAAGPVQRGALLQQLAVQLLEAVVVLPKHLHGSRWSFQPARPRRGWARRSSARSVPGLGLHAGKPAGTETGRAGQAARAPCALARGTASA